MPLVVAYTQDILAFSCQSLSGLNQKEHCSPDARAGQWRYTLYLPCYNVGFRTLSHQFLLNNGLLGFPSLECDDASGEDEIGQL